MGTTDMRGESPMGCVKLTYVVTYHSPPRVADATDIFDTAGVNFSLSGAQATDDQASDLVEDINAALAAAGLSDLVDAKSSGTSSQLGQARVKFEAAAGVGSLEITAAPGNVLGLAPSTTATKFAGKLIADSAGNKLVLSAVEGGGITAFTVTANAAAAAALGFKQGSTSADNVDFEIRVSNPTQPDDVVRVTLGNVTTIADVIAAIESAMGGTVEVRINAAKTGLTLIDKTFAPVVLDSSGKLIANPNARSFSVTAVNGSAAAVSLGLAGVDSLSVTSLDGRIDGGQLIGVKLTDRFFMKNVSLGATLQLSTPQLNGAGAVFDTDGDGSTNDGISATANFGFVSVHLQGSASLNAEFSVGLKDPTLTGPGADGQISLTEFIDGLSHFGDLIDKPSLTGLGQLDLGIDVDGLDSFITIPASAGIGLDANLGDLFNRWADTVDLAGANPVRASNTTITLTGDFRDDLRPGARVTVPVVGGAFDAFVAGLSFAAGVTTVTLLDNPLTPVVLPALLTGLSIGTPNSPIFDFRSSDLDDLLSFNNIDFSFAAIIDALVAVGKLLNTFDSAAVVMNQPIPLRQFLRQ